MESQTQKNMPADTAMQRVPFNHPAHHPKTEKLPTVTVRQFKKQEGQEERQDDKKGDGISVINRQDFNPELHELLDEDEAKEVAREDLATAKPGDPTEEYKVFKSFDFNNLHFEKNDTITIRHSVAKDLSKRFRCIWRASDLKKVDENPSLRDGLLRGKGGEIEEIDPADEKNASK